MFAGSLLSPHSATGASKCRAESTSWLMRWRDSEAALVRRPLFVYRRPDGAVALSFDRRDKYGIPVVFAVLAKRVDGRCRATWYRVQLPTRPNHSTGWVRARDVRIFSVKEKILVDLSRRRLFLYVRGRLVLRSPAAIGKPGTRTPTGRFYVIERFIPSDPHGPFGPRALGLSAHSDVLTSWRDGGPIGIHGTNERFSIGRPVSHGCIRLPNRQISRLFRRTWLGTPVLIRP
jgi:L,D-transpeptidase catalytic domain